MKIKGILSTILCSGQGFTDKNDTSPYDLAEIHKSFPCLLLTRPDKDPLNSHFLSYKWLAELLAPPPTINQSKMVINQKLVKILSFPQVSELWPILSLRESTDPP